MCIWEGGRCKQTNLLTLKFWLLTATTRAKFVAGTTDAADERDALRIALLVRANGHLNVEVNRLKPTVQDETKCC
jgi:hypothetical protein